MLTELLARAAESSPAKAAVVQGPRRVSYGELADLSARAAAGLRALGVREGDCVTVALPNSPEFVAALYAAVRVRAVVLPLDPSLTDVELLRFVADVRARVVVAEPARLGRLSAPGVTVSEFATLLEHAAFPPQGGRFEGRALYLYTSGSTDTAKRLCCTQDNLVHEARNFVETVGLGADDAILCAIPLHHSYGLGNGLLDAVYTGATLVLPEPTDAPFVARCRHLVDLIRVERVTFYPGVPHQFQVLASLPDEPGIELAGLRLCVSSGDVLPRSTFERFRERFGLPIRSLYGSTEAGSISMNTDPDELVTYGSLGPPLRSVEIRIRDEQGRDLPANAAGQIWVGSSVIPPTAYENRPELSAAAFREGFYNTGDLGLLDERGHLLMTGRKQSFVDVVGRKVDVAEVEEVLGSHPQVREAVVLGVEVPGLGTLLKAVVAADAPCGEGELLMHCRRRLAAFKVPRLIEFRDALPRSATGKILRSELGGLEAGPGRQATSASDLASADELAGRIQEQAAACLQSEPESIERSTPFHTLGFDSLRAAELHLRLVALTGLPIPITLLWNYPTVGELAAALWERMNAGHAAGTHAATSPVDGTPETTGLVDLIGGVDSLSDSEIDAALRTR
jgi:long-chain acyl-CoA synthetase